MLRFKLSFLTLFVFCFPNLGFAAFKASLAGTVVNTQYNYSGISSTQGGLGFGGALLFQYQKKKRVSFETGGMFLNRSFEDSVGSTASARAVSSIVVPITAFLHIGKSGRLQLGAGGFFNMVTGMDSYSGVQGQLRFIWGKNAKRKYFLAAQYLNGLQKDNVGIAHKDMLVLLGISFGKSAN